PASDPSGADCLRKLHFVSVLTIHRTACLTLRTPHPSEAAVRRCLSHLIIAAVVACVLIFPRFSQADPRGDAEDARRRLEWAESQLCHTRDDLCAAQAALNAAAARQSDALAALS